MEPVPPPRKSGVSLIGAFFGMLITFLGGIYVGAHPGWFPSKMLNGADNGPSKVISNPATLNDPSKDTHGPTTLPTSKP
jgi:hypothetical protein